MDRYEYLGTLKYYLRGVPEKEVDQIIEELKSHFVEAELSGKTDEETAAELGDPKIVAAEILEEHEEMEEQLKETKSASFNFGTYVSDMVSKAMDVASKSAVVVDMRKDKKSKDEDLREENEENEFLEYVITEEVHSIILKSTMTDFKVKKSKDDRVVIETDNENLKYTLTKGTLHITDNGGKKSGIFKNLKSVMSDTTVIYIPEKHYDLFEVTTTVGDFYASRIDAKEVNLNNSVGNLTIDKIVADEVKASVKTGDTTLTSVETKKLTASVATGDLDIIGINPDANMKISVSVGDATIKYNSMPKDITVQLKNTMGTIKTNGLFKTDDKLGEGTALVTGSVSMGDLKFKLL